MSHFCTGSEYPTTDFPLASTCALELTLASKFHNDYEMFKDKLVYNHGGFGMHAL